MISDYLYTGPFGTGGFLERRALSVIIEREDRSIMMKLEAQGLKLVVHGSMYTFCSESTQTTQFEATYLINICMN